MGGRGGPETAGGCFGVEELSEVLRSLVVDGLESEKQNLKNDAVCDGVMWQIKY